MKQRTSNQMKSRVCPHYRLPQLRQYRLPQLLTDSNLGPEHRQPVCAALEAAITLDPETARTLCRSGAYPTCRRFIAALPMEPGRHPTESGPDITRRLLSSAMWVIGIPTVITILIMFAAWLTENVWAPTHAVIYQLF